MSRVVALVLVAAAFGAGACGHLQAFPDAVRAWQSGRRGEALAAARGEVERWQDGNGLAAAEVARAVAEVDDAFRDPVPLVVPGDEAPPDPRAGVDDAPERPRRTLDQQLSTDLLSNRATSVLRAIRSVEALALDHHGPEVLAIVFRREPVEADGGLLATWPAAVRSVATKRVALRALEALASPRKPVL